MNPSQICSPGPPPLRRARMANGDRRLLAWACGVILLLCPLAHALRQQRGSGLGSQGEAGTPQQAQDVVCPGDGRAAGKTFAATLSESEPKVTLQCHGSDTAVPADLVKGSVCPETVTTLANCGGAEVANRSKQQPVSLSVLMGGAESSQVKWVQTSTGGQERKYELGLPNAPLPLLDAKFVTGCAPPSQEKTAGDNECRLEVTVEARKSAATGQTVYCAYGEKSNQARPIVRMTAKDNTMTLVCGNKNTTAVRPTQYTTSYCVDEKVSDTCAKESYTSFIKDFQASWWTSNADAKSVTLTIPPEHFPEASKTIHLGCEYTPQTAPPKTPEPAQRTCSVDVVISAKESSALGRTVAALPALSLAALTVSVSASMLM